MPLGSVVFVALLGCTAAFVFASPKAVARVLGAAPAILLAVVIGIWNPWNLVVVDRLLAHPFLAASGLSLMCVVALFRGLPASGDWSLPHLVVAGVVVGPCVAASVLTVVVQGKIAGGVLGVLGLAVLAVGDFVITKWRAPMLVSVVPLIAVGVVALPAGAFVNLFDPRTAAGPKRSDGAVELVSTDIDGHCQGKGYFLVGGTGIASRELLISGLDCGATVRLEGQTTVVIQCRGARRSVHRVTIDPSTLDVLDDDQRASLFDSPFRCDA